jgi:hypothetical protein
VNKEIIPSHWGWIRTIALCATALGIGGASLAFGATNTTSAMTYQQTRTAVVERFTTPSESAMDSAALASQACNRNGGAASTGAATASNYFSVDPKTLGEISTELQKQLSKSMPVMVNPDPKGIPAGSVIVSGCISKATKGSAAKRMVGMGWGSSQMAAHIVFLSKTETGLVPMDSFELRVKGRAILPPLGPVGVAVHAVREPRETLSADGKKLADQTATRLSSEMK